MLLNCDKNIKHTIYSIFNKIINAIYCGLECPSPSASKNLNRTLGLGSFSLFFSAFIIAYNVVKPPISDYSTKQHRMQTTYQNTHFLRYFGRNDFKAIDKNDVVQSVRYLLKYIEKSGERLVYGGDLPTYFKSDVMDEDIVCHTGIDDRKALLFDDFNCWDEGCLIGKASSETISQLFA